MRRYPDASGNLILSEGDYGKKDGTWHIRPPGSHLGSIPHHKVTEHKDGTITVIPSIAVEGVGDEKGWHGYLIRGKFSETGGGKDE